MDQNGSDEADDMLRISPDKNKNESNEKDKQQTTRFKGKQYIRKIKISGMTFLHSVRKLILLIASKVRLILLEWTWGGMSTFFNFFVITQ